RAVARLVTAGLPLRLERLTAGRAHRHLDLDHLPPEGLDGPATPSTWLVNGSRARPLAGPEPPRLGTVGAPAHPAPRPRRPTPPDSGTPPDATPVRHPGSKGSPGHPVAPPAVGRPPAGAALLTHALSRHHGNGPPGPTEAMHIPTNPSQGHP